MKPGDSKADKGVIQDEADATVREGARQAAEEKARLLQIADDAEIAAAAEDSAPAAKRTFWNWITQAHP
jgi:hypothetical protein